MKLTNRGGRLQKIVSVHFLVSPTGSTINDTSNLIYSFFKDIFYLVALQTTSLTLCCFYLKSRFCCLFHFDENFVSHKGEA